MIRQFDGKYASEQVRLIDKHMRHKIQREIQCEIRRDIRRDIQREI